MTYEVWPQTAQFYNERISTDPILVTWQNTVYEPPEDGLKKDRNMYGQVLSVLMWILVLLKCIYCVY
jgi:hypothetical protein